MQLLRVAEAMQLSGRVLKWKDFPDQLQQSDKMLPRSLGYSISEIYNKLN